MWSAVTTKSHSHPVHVLLSPSQARSFDVDAHFENWQKAADLFEEVDPGYRKYEGTKISVCHRETLISDFKIELIQPHFCRVRLVTFETWLGHDHREDHQWESTSGIAGLPDPEECLKRYKTQAEAACDGAHEFERFLNA